jgi:hypothetical protein
MKLFWFISYIIPIYFSKIFSLAMAKVAMSRQTIFSDEITKNILVY